MRLNLSEVEDRSFEALPAGRYVVKFSGFEMRETQDKPGNKLPAGTPMINWEMTVLRDAKTGDTKYENRRLWTNTIIHERTLFNLKGILKACGWSDEDLSEELDFDPEQVVGAEVVAVVATREYQGDTVNDVKRFTSLDSLADDQKASSLLP